MDETRCQHFEETPAFDAATGKRVSVVGLCTWGDTHTASAEKLLDTPRWLQREALSGHHWRHGDCQGCPGFQIKPIGG